MGADKEQGGRPEHLWMVALYDDEQRTAELLMRLGALGVETSEATIVRVALDDAAAIEYAAQGRGVTVSPPARHALTGAIVGSSAALLMGLLLYGMNLARLGFVEGLFAHALASALAGAALGALLGVVYGALAGAGRRVKRASAPPATSPDGYLVAVKMSPGVAEQAEEIARHLGAKKILL
ncbi:MAG: hypothetical protein KF868_22330 [Acidobacteria bacterium]|nr:hypothetical protein [Acidobacteriota bacterium]MCW5970491.1 hypothetical protein [Blastocatellales bacterium]